MGRHPFILPLLIILAGIGARLMLFISGRIPLDGDEAIMGIMAAYMATFEQFPLYFYGQHYMGTIEVPGLAFLMLLGPESWDFSAWPIRIIEWIYFAILAWLQFKICERCFGRRAALFCLLFLSFAPGYWMDYSSRLRHVTFMMLLGSALILITLHIIDRWRENRLPDALQLYLFGLIAGLAWWHYQLILIYFAVITGLFLLASRLPSLFRNSLNNLKGNPFAGIAGIILLTLSCAIPSLLSLAWGASWFWAQYPDFYYIHTFAILVVPGSIGAVLLYRSSMRATLPVFTGYIVGYAPAILYLATLREEFWLTKVVVQMGGIPRRLYDLLLLEGATIFELNPVDSTGNASLDPVTLVLAILYFLTLYLLARRAWDHRKVTQELDGYLIFGVIFAATILLNLIIPRPTRIDEPRFLVPIFASTAVAFGLAIDHAISSAKTRSLRVTLAIVLSALLIVPWGYRWSQRTAEPMAWPSGHRSEVDQLITALGDNGIERVLIGSNTSSILLGHELQFAGRMRIRFNRGEVERLEGRIDESRFSGPLYLMKDDPKTSRGANGIRVGDYLIYESPHRNAHD